MSNINNYSDSTVLTGTASGDSITNSGSYVTINGGDGNDTISSSVSSWSHQHSYGVIYGGAGEDSIYNYGTNATIFGGAGNDSIRNDSYESKIDGGDGNDYFYLAGDMSTIDGGADNDIIYCWYGWRTKIDGGAGADFVSLGYSSYSNYVTESTISGGTGNDTIYLSSNTTVGNIFQYNSGDGSDLIYNATRYDTISIGGASYTTTISSSYLIIKVGDGAMTLVGAANTAVNIVGEYSEDTLPAGLSISGGVLSIGSTFDGDSIRASDYDATKVDATALSRGIKIWGGNAADCILGGSGNDTIHGSNGADTLFGNAGNDCLSGGNGNDVLYGGAGADKMLGGNGNDTLYGGAGNDTLTGGNGNDTFVYESGSDLITDYRAGYDKIKIASGSITGSSISGSNVILTTSGGSLTVKNGRGKNLTVIDASGNETTRKYFNSGSSAMLFADDNFIGGGANLDAITESKSAVTEIENPVQEPTQIYQSSIIASAKSTTA